MSQGKLSTYPRKSRLTQHPTGKQQSGIHSVKGIFFSSVLFVLNSNPLFVLSLFVLPLFMLSLFMISLFMLSLFMLSLFVLSLFVLCSVTLSRIFCFVVFLLSPASIVSSAYLMLTLFPPIFSPPIFLIFLPIILLYREN